MQLFELSIGNPNNWRDGMTFTWQAGRQLATLQKGTTGVSYTYGSDGTRLTKTVNGVKTSYTWDGAQLVSQTTTGGDTLYFIYHGDSRVAVEYKGNTYYYIYNLQGDVVGLVNSNGTTVVSYTYDAWGNPESITGSMASTLGAANPFRYRSYYFDTESGLYYLMSRYYDPVVGRWLNADAYLTSSSFLGCNAFVYCYNNPIMYVDYTGSIPEWLYILAAGLAVADGPLPFGDLILLGIAAAGAYCALSALPQIEVPERHLTEIIPFPTPPQKDKNDNKKKEPFVPSVPVPQTSPDEDNNRGYTVWFANYNRKTKQIEKGPGISFEKALTYLLAGQDQSFICIDGQTAKMLTNPFSKTRIYEIDKNKDGVEGYYYHYHLDNNHGNPHVWHYGGALLYPY